MTIRLSLDQLDERLQEFCYRGQNSKPPYSTLYLAEYRYLSKCKDIKKARISQKSPRVVNAERIYRSALLLEAEGGDIKRVACKILSAEKQLLQVLVQNYRSKNPV